LHFTAGYLKLSLEQEPTHRVLPFSAAIALCPLEAPGRSSCREKNTPTPQILNTKYQKGFLFITLTKYRVEARQNRDDIGQITTLGHAINRLKIHEGGRSDL
jgi:hypothetical protein